MHRRLAVLAVGVAGVLAFVVGPQLAGAAGAVRPPTLGVSWQAHQEGLGRVLPATVSLGRGDRIVRDIRWSGWGTGTARGRGRTETSAHPGVAQIVDVAAFDQGTCNGRFMYQALDWWFPAAGQHLDRARFVDVCTGTPVGPGRPAQRPQASYPKCTRTALGEALEGAGYGNRIVGFACDGGYAYAFVEVPPQHPRIEETAALFARGTQWRVVDRATNCRHAAWPARLYRSACQTN